MTRSLSALFIAGAALLSGCAAISLQPGAAAVRVVTQDPKGCTYLGEATGNQGNFFTGAFTSNESLETGSRNALKNAASELHGNTVVLLTNRAGQTSSWNRQGGGSHETNVVMTGAVYDCPGDGLAAR
jgi:hypothetical protein